MDFQYLFELLCSGVVKGSIYALIALGYTMVYGIIQLINFAHGEIYMIGAFVAFIVAGVATLSGFSGFSVLILAAVIAAIYSASYGFTLERIAYRPLRNAPRLTPLITAIGMSIVLQNLAMMIWGRNYLTFPSLLPKVNFELAGAHFTAIQVIIVLVSGATMAGLLGLIYRTKLGMAMRATAIMRTNSNGSSSALPCSGVPATCTSRLIGTESGCAGRLASASSSPARCARVSPMPTMPPQQVFSPASRTCSSVSSRSWYWRVWMIES